MSRQASDFTKGPIFGPLIAFSLPVMLSMILQTAYGAVDLWMVGKFATAADVSAVSTGTQLMMSVTSVVFGLAVGTTVLMGQSIGSGETEKTGKVMGGSIALFAVIALVLTALVAPGAGILATWTNAPESAYPPTVTYIRICGCGLLFITAYNILGAVFRGMGDSRTPLMTVAIATVCNIIGDYVLVAVFHLGATGTAIATVGAQAVSVVFSLLFIRRRGLPFPFSGKDIRFSGEIIRSILKLGTPPALSEGLVSISFLVILSIVNDLGLVASAGVGVAEKLCGFIMLIPSALSQSIMAFVAQNIGAGEEKRARRVLYEGIGISLAFGLVCFWASFFHGDVLCGLFTGDQALVMAGWDYLKAYAIDTLLTSFLFSFMGYFNGVGRTTFVMAQSLVGAFFVRIPVSFLMSRLEPVSLFRVGLATPSSSFVQIILCGVYLFYLGRKTTIKRG